MIISSQESEGDVSPDLFPHWFDKLWERHTKELTFQEIRKAVQALSRGYVETRGKRVASALGSAGKRAGFALFYPSQRPYLQKRSRGRTRYVLRHEQDRQSASFRLNPHLAKEAKDPGRFHPIYP